MTCKYFYLQEFSNFVLMKTDLTLLEYLEEMLTPARTDLFKRVLSNRTRHFTVVVQDVYQLHNASAVIRSCDVFGVQDIHIIEEQLGKRVDREIAMGAQKWVDVHRHSSSEHCLEGLKKDGYAIVATSPHKGTALQDFDISGKAAFCFGNERDGLSSEVLEMADEFLHIPMVGFTESLNLSVSAAIVLQELTYRLRNSQVDWKLSQEEIFEKRLDWTKKNLKSIDLILERYHNQQFHNS